ncbi:MAG TPA: YibE/F family protein [Candidatus Saccharimonadales bacterium]|nr:YibE/F family protein [Candidatus Saccharimonadales bacterium]
MTLHRYVGRLKKSVFNKISRRHILLGLIIFIVLFFSAFYLLRLSPYKAQTASSSFSSNSQTQYVRAKVLNPVYNQSDSGTQSVQVRILDGPSAGRVVTVSRSYLLGDPNSRRLPVGSKVLLTIEPNNGNQYSYLDRYRIQGAVTLLIALLILVVAIGRWRGITGALGLTVSIGILAVFVLPRIIAGHAAFATCIEGSFMIATVSIFIAHGFTKRTTVAFVSTIATLFLVIGIAAVAVHLTGVTGNPGATVNNEQQTSLIEYAPHYIDLSGLFLGGMVIASLGILEDITTCQAAAVDEIYKANHKQSIGQLYKKGLSVGREHVAALINTLAIVYVGIALPTIVLTILYTGHSPLLVTLNDETIIEAVVRTIVPSIGLLLAVPLATYLSAYILPKWYGFKRSG